MRNHDLFLPIARQRPRSTKPASTKEFNSLLEVMRVASSVAVLGLIWIAAGMDLSAFAAASKGSLPELISGMSQFLCETLGNFPSALGPYS